MTRALIDGVPRKDTVVLVDTNVVMEAVRTRCWNAVMGGLCVETVEECRDEALRGDRGRPGYLPVSTEDLGRLHQVHPVSAVERAAFGMTYDDARNMDRGERDLFAHAFSRVSRGDAVWIVCPADKACTAVALGWHERMHCLAALSAAVGATPNPPCWSSTGSAGCRGRGRSSCSARRRRTYTGSAKRMGLTRSQRSFLVPFPP